MQQKHKIILSVLAVIMLGFYFYPSEYDKLMNPIKKIKAKEKKEGRPNPIYDGVIEPDFPNETLNNSSFAGVDSNNDGVRDDIEIWINRKSEDNYVRLSLKSEYRHMFKFYSSILQKSSEPVVRNNYADWVKSGMCFSITLYPYVNKRIKDGTIDEETYHRDRLYSNMMEDIFLNSPKRMEVHAKYVRYNFEEAISFGVAGDLSYCDKSIDQFYLKNLFDNQNPYRRYSK